MLLQNIVKSPYFQKCCRDITDWNSLVDQIYYDVKHVEPWAHGKFDGLVFVGCIMLHYFVVTVSQSLTSYPSTYQKGT
jgi:pre-mRNA-splicing factor 38B